MGIVANLVRLSIVTGLGAAISRRWEPAYVSIGCLVTALGVAFSRMNKTLDKLPADPPLVPGKIRICVAGYTHSAPTAKAHYLADLIAQENPDKFETLYHWDTTGTYFSFLKLKFGSPEIKFRPEHKGHATSPAVWTETLGPDGKVVIDFLGGSCFFGQYAAENGWVKKPENVEFAKTPWNITWYILGDSYHVGIGRPQSTALAGKK